jgi:hypothetical protein
LFLIIISGLFTIILFLYVPHDSITRHIFMFTYCFVCVCVRACVRAPFSCRIDA